MTWMQRYSRFCLSQLEVCSIQALSYFLESAWVPVLSKQRVDKEEEGEKEEGEGLDFANGDKSSLCKLS